MKTWQDCPGKDSEQNPGKPGHVVSPDAPNACNHFKQDDHDAVHANGDDYDAVHADDADVDGDDDNAKKAVTDDTCTLNLWILP